MADWTLNEIETLQSQLNKSTKEIYLIFCDKFGTQRTYDSVQKKIKKLRDAYSDEPDEIFDPIEAEDRVENLFEDILNQGGTSIRKRTLKQEAKDWIEGVIELNKEINQTQVYKISKGNKSTLVILISDAHFGKITDEYNMSVAKQRLLEIPTKLKTRILTEIDEIVVVLAGDLVEGEDIFAGQNISLECPVLTQAQNCAEAIWIMLRNLRCLFGVLVRVEMVPGNHGRMSKTAGTISNWDNVVYVLLNTMSKFSDDEDLVFNLNLNKFVRFNIKGQTCLAYHKGVKHTSTPAMREKVASWIATKKFNFLVHGHWHEWHIGTWLDKTVIANGCLCGPDDLAEEMARENTARQAYFLVTPDIEEKIHSFGFIEWK